MNFDAVVIDAGAIGVSTAFRMVEAGLKVALVDRAFPGYGTSRATKGGIGVYPKKPRANLELNIKGAALFPDLVARLGRDVERDMSGVLNLSLTEGRWRRCTPLWPSNMKVPAYRPRLSRPTRSGRWNLRSLLQWSVPPIVRWTER